MALTPPTLTKGLIPRVFAAFVIAAIAATIGFIALGSDEAVAAGPDEIVVRARGNSGAEVMELVLNGQVSATWTASTQWADYTYTVDSALAVSDAEVRFVNDGGVTRDLFVDYINIAGTKLQSEHSSTVSTGTFVPGAGCVERSSISHALHCAGSFDYSVPAGTVVGRSAASGELVTFRALGKTGEEEVQLVINGDRVRTANLSTSFQNYTYDVPAGMTIISAEILYTNDIPGRDAQIDWLEVDGQRYESEHATTRATGILVNDLCVGNVESSSEWLRCNGWFRYPIGSPAAAAAPVSNDTPASEETVPAPATPPPTPAPGTEAPTTTSAPATTAAPATTRVPATTTAPATTRAPATTAAPAPARSSQPIPAVSNGTSERYSIAQVIDGTIGAGDGSNPNEEAPMGRHDAPLSLPQGWNWTQGPTRNSQWGNLGTGGSRFVEWRCAVIPESGHTPSVPFRINVRNGAYYQFANGNWDKAFDVNLLGGNHGGYLGVAGRENQNPFDAPSQGLIQWRQEADGSFSAPWNANALMMHFWAGQRQPAAPGQTAEFLTSEIRLQQPDGRTVDLSDVRVLFQCGVDYYNTTGGQGTRVPGPGIAKYSFATPQWQPGLWVTLPGNVPAASVGDFQSWLGRNTPPNVG